MRRESSEVQRRTPAKLHLVPGCGLWTLGTISGIQKDVFLTQMQHAQAALASASRCGPVSLRSSLLSLPQHRHLLLSLFVVFKQQP